MRVHVAAFPSQLAVKRSRAASPARLFSLCNEQAATDGASLQVWNTFCQNKRADQRILNSNSLSLCPYIEFFSQGGERGLSLPLPTERAFSLSTPSPVLLVMVLRLHTDKSG